MKNWEKHQERISKAKCTLEFTGMITDLYGDFRDYCRKNECGMTYNNCYKCYECYHEWLNKEAEEEDVSQEV